MGSSDRRKLFDSFWKMNPTTWLSLVIAVFSLATPAQSSEPRVVCYYTNWSVYRPGTARFNPQNINPYLCTHLIYAFGGFTKDNTLKPFDKYQDIEKGGYAKFTGLKTYNKNLKTLLAIGGWNEGSTRFSPLVASRERRKEFVRNAIKFLRQNRFDGLDLDWEYPAFRDGGKPKDRENYAKLVRELREEFEKEAEKTGKPRLLLTMAVPAGIEYILKGFDIKTLNQYLDWMNLLTYDYHSAFEPAVNHHAPLYPLEEPNEYSVDNELNIDYTIKFYLENGADREKLVLGIPTYGRSYTLFNKDAFEIGSPADGPGEQGDATREKGYLAYYEICEALKPKEKKKRSRSDDSDEDSSEEVEDEPWKVVQPNPNALGPFAYKGNQWVGYDDIDIVKKKAEYVADNGLGGIMFWSIDNDDFRGSCHGKPYPLIESAKESYIVRLGSTDNAIVTDRPRSVTTVRSTSNRRRNRPRSSSTTTTERSTTAAKSSNKRKSGSSITSTTPSWKIVTPEPPTTPDPGSDFKCTDEGFFPHPRDCKKYFWCLDSGPSNLGIVAHQFTCPSGLFFNKAADSCDFARNVLCKKPGSTIKPPITKSVTTTSSPVTTTTTRKPVKLSTKSSSLFRTTSSTTITPELEEDDSGEEYEDVHEDSADVDAEDPTVIKELINLIKKVGGVEELEKQLHLRESVSTDGTITTTPSNIAINKRLYQKVLERTRAKSSNLGSNSVSENGGSSLSSLYSRRGPQNAGLEATADKDQLLKKDRPQYTTINRSRPSTSTQQPKEEEEEDLNDRRQGQSRVLEETRGTTAKPLQYVNIRRARPLETSDTADDTASRNALFERTETYVAEPQNTLDVASARRENIPEYVTIRRQRPTTEEATTEQYHNTEADKVQETALEREISSPQLTSQPQYTSIVRARSTTTPAPEENSPEPTTVLAVQISSLLNEQSSSEAETLDEDVKTTVADEPETVPTTSTTTTTRPSTSTRKTIRRRGSTTTTTTQATPSSTTQVTKRSFFRRTVPTAAPGPDPEVENKTSKYTRRTNFKSRTSTETPETSPKNPEADKKTVELPKTEGNEKIGGKRGRRPSLNSSGARNERPTQNFVRRRLGGANATTTTTPSSSSSSLASSRRPFRVASRRRPLPTTSTTATKVTTTTTTTETPTTTPISEDSLQDIGDTDFIEYPTPEDRPTLNLTKTRRPLLLKDEPDQNPSATNEEERKRHSKKYSASFKQNQLDEVLKKREQARSQEVEVTTEELKTTAVEHDAETAIAIATHQLLSAPLPSESNYEDEPRNTKKSSRPPQAIHEYEYTSPTYTNEYSTKNTYDYSSTPLYKENVENDYIQTTTGSFYDITTNFNSARNTASSYIPKTPTYPPSPFTSKVSRPAAFTANILSTLSEDRTTEFSRIPQNPTVNPYRSTEGRGFTRASTSTLSSGFNNVASSLGPSTARFVSSTDKLIPVPVEDYGFTTGGYSSISQEPSYFTREYLLESPVTKTYDDEYQYLSPTTPQTTTRKMPKKIVYRKISTTIPPTVQSYLPEVTKPTARRVSNRKPFEKIPINKEVHSKYKPNEDFDYYDEGGEMASKYQEGTKVILHSKGIIECLDIGNFPHPLSCKKFISCARLENASLLGWEYICPKGLSFDPVGGICNWSAGLGCHEKDPE